MNKAVFFDRDGTLSVEVGYIDNVEDFELYPGVSEVLSGVKNLGFKLVVITNQSGVARGYFPENRVHEINRHMSQLLSVQGIVLDGIYYCPHHVDGTVPEYSIECSCRKPSTGMILKAQDELSIDLTGSWMIGDNISDIKCGRNAGLKTVLVRTGHGRDYEEKLKSLPLSEQPHFVAETLYDVYTIIKENTTD